MIPKEIRALYSIFFDYDVKNDKEVSHYLSYIVWHRMHEPLRYRSRKERIGSSALKAAKIILEDLRKQVNDKNI